jgi:hypothetical protein
MKGPGVHSSALLTLFGLTCAMVALESRCYELWGESIMRYLLALFFPWVTFFTMGDVTPCSSSRRR